MNLTLLLARACAQRAQRAAQVLDGPRWSFPKGVGALLCFPLVSSPKRDPPPPRPPGPAIAVQDKKVKFLFLKTAHVEVEKAG